MKHDDPKTIYLKDYHPADFLMDEVFLHFDLYEDKTQVTALLHLRRHPQSSDPQASLVLSGEAMALQSVAVDGKALSATDYRVTDSTLTVNSVPDQFILETVVHIQPQENKQLSGLYTSRTNFCTQCEPHGFRRITYFLDRPDVMSRFTTTITADQAKYPYLLSNGNLLESTSLPGGRHRVRWEDPSLKPCYLFALVAGDFDVLSDTLTTMSGRSVDLKLYLEKGFSDQGAYALASLKRAMRWDEEKWGREYDLDVYMIVAVSDFNMGAMENKGLNIFNTKYVLAKQETATDQDYFNIEAVIGHEYFHNWSGNRVTCRDWFQITLKEGLTVFRDQSFSIDMTSASVARIPEIDIMRTSQFSEDRGPLSHPIRPDRYIEVNNFYTLTVYRKGAEVIRMVQTLLTPALFRKGLDLYFDRHDGQAVTTEDFIQAMEDISGRDLTHFKQWYSQKGTPELEIDGEYDEKAQTYRLTVKQNQPPLHLPLSIGLVGPGCHDMPTQLAGEADVIEGTRVLELSQPQQTFTFIHVTEKPTPSLLRHFSAPVKYQYPYTNQELAWLLQCDSDPYSRWNAGQSLLTNHLLVLSTAYSQQRPMKISDLLIDTYRTLLDSSKDDLNLFSKLFMLPSENFLLSKMSVPHVETIHAAHQHLKHQLGLTLSEALMTLYQQCHDDGVYEYTVESMGRRSVKNVCLSYLVATKQQPFVDLAVKQFDNSDNMTDTMGALQALNHHDGPERADRLNAFYECWQYEPLVVNKWLNLHALSSLPDTFESVKLLLDHPAFDIDNPNNVYALLCGFSMNQIRFHDISGETYLFMADQVLSLDSKNPQVAARLLQSLIPWQQLDEQRGEMMRAQIERISKTPGISPDVYEISTKSK